MQGEDLATKEIKYTNYLILSRSNDKIYRNVKSITFYEIKICHSYTYKDTKILFKLGMVIEKVILATKP